MDKKTITILCSKNFHIVCDVRNEEDLVALTWKADGHQAFKSGIKGHHCIFVRYCDILLL